MWQQIVVRLRHLARDFGVAALVRVEQRVAAEVEGHRQHGGQEQQRQPHVRAEGWGGYCVRSQVLVVPEEMGVVVESVLASAASGKP